MHTHTRLLPRLHLVQLCLLLLCAFLLTSTSGCRSPVARTAMDSPTRQVTTTTDRRGNVTETVLDNSGRAAAGEGQVVSTTSPAIEALAEKINGDQWSYTELTYSMIDEANVALLSEKKEQHRDALSAMDKAMAAGDMNKYALAAEAVAALAGEIKNLIAKSNAPKTGGDRLSLAGKTLSVGVGHGDVIREQSKEFGLSVRSRHANPGTETQTTTSDRVDISSTDEIKAVLESRDRLAALQARTRELELLAAMSRAEGKPAVEDISDAPEPAAEDTSVTPAARTAYDQLTKKNFLYKTRLATRNPVTRHDSAVLIPKDRPKVVDLKVPGQVIRENYFSTSEDRWIIRLAGALPDTPADIVATYVDGQSETFRVDSLAGRTDRPAGPYRGTISVSAATADPVPPGNEVIPDPVNANEFSTIPAP